VATGVSISAEGVYEEAEVEAGVESFWICFLFSGVERGMELQSSVCSALRDDRVHQRHRHSLTHSLTHTLTHTHAFTHSPLVLERLEGDLVVYLELQHEGGCVRGVLHVSRGQRGKR
jgi:hypothetical protein